jgi:hypothetical protein
MKIKLVVRQGKPQKTCPTSYITGLILLNVLIVITDVM